MNAEEGRTRDEHWGGADEKSVAISIVLEE